MLCYKRANLCYNLHLKWSLYPYCVLLDSLRVGPAYNILTVKHWIPRLQLFFFFLFTSNGAHCVLDQLALLNQKQDCWHNSAYVQYTKEFSFAV